MLVLLAFALATSALGQDGSEEALESGLTVEVAVSRLFLDVEVVDADGRPLPGLTKDDFSLRLNNRRYPIRSVDDLCGCAEGSALPRTSPNFILYFDFSQIAAWSREMALAEAERWVLEIKRPEDRASIVAYASDAGLRTLCRLTDDAELLLAAIRGARTDPGLRDPFPDGFPRRFQHCLAGTVSCHNSGMREYRQTQRSAEVLVRFLTRMDSLPGRKEMLLFYQNNAVYPGCLFTPRKKCERFFDGRRSDSVPGLEELVGEITATAVAGGTMIYPILSGPASDWSVDFGEDLASATGGRFDRKLVGIGKDVEQAGRGCACMYRIGVDPPSSKSSRVLRVKVAVRDGKWLPPDFRLLQLTDEERWRRNAEAVLLDPEGATELPLSAAILPVGATAKRWDARLVVRLDPRSLGLLPEGDKRVASWEIGAVLVRRGGRGGIEMLGVSRVNCPKAGCTTAVVHQRVVEGLRPGTYELRAFAHDRWSNAYGGAKAAIELPAPDEPSLIGPVLVASDTGYFATDLPLRSDKPRAAESRTTLASRGMLPPREGEEPTGALAWVCGTETADAVLAATDGLWPERTPPGRGAEPTVERIGECWSVAEKLQVSPPVSIAVAAAAAAPAAAAPAPPPPAAPVVLAAPTAVGSDDERTALRPSNVALDALLEALAAQAAVYRDSALRFTCDETVVEHDRRKSRMLEFEYTYAYDDKGVLRDQRMTHRAAERVRQGKGLPEPVDPASTGLRAFVLRAYSAIFIFAREHRHLYEFEVLGEEQTLGRSAVKVGIRAVPPYIDGLNDWFGAAWVDLESGQLLRFRGFEAEDRAAKELFDKSIVQQGTPVRQRSRSFDEIDVEFGVESGPIRFPSRVVLERTEFEVSRKAGYLRTPAVKDLRVVQSYDNYRIFGVHATESILDVETSR